MNVVTETIQLTVLAKDVQKGDIIVTAGKARTVGDLKVGRKNVELFDENAKSVFYAPLDSEVRVTREVETEESKTARLEESKNRLIQKDIERHQAGAYTAAQKVANDILQYGKTDSFALTNLISFQATDQVWAEWIKAHNYMTSEERGEERKSSSQALELFVAGKAKDVVRKASYGLLSRSTSVVSNVMEDAELAAWAEFVDQASRYNW